MSELDGLCERVLSIMVESFGFSDAEARHRLALWRAEQHQLEGQALEILLPAQSAGDQAESLRRWLLEGDQIRSDLLDGAAALRLDLSDYSPTSLT